MGRQVFNVLSKASGWLRPRDFALQVDGHTVFLKLDDPRLLQIPNELACSNPNRRALEQLVQEGDTFRDFKTQGEKAFSRPAPAAAQLHVAGPVTKAAEANLRVRAGRPSWLSAVLDARPDPTHRAVHL